MEQVKRLQSHLGLIRNCVGWSAAALGDKLDVSRQMISNLETGRNEMNRMNYLAIRKVLDDEILRSSEETEMLQLVLEYLVDNPEKYTAEQRNEIKSKAEMLAPAMMKKPSDRKAVSNSWKTLLIAGGVITGAAIAAVLSRKGK